MTLPTVETFEHDIAAEIIKKESTMSKAASVENLVHDVSEEINQKPKESSSSAVLVGIILLSVVALAIASYFGYTYYVKLNTPDTVVETSTQKAVSSTETKTPFATIFPDLNDVVGEYVTKLDKNPYGFAITISDYTKVFSYITKNEEPFARAIARVLPTGTGGGTEYIFTDVTISNINMRIGASASSTVAYAFLETNTKILIISTSTEGLSAIASGIIK